MRLPSGSSPGKYCRAKVSLTTTVRGAESSFGEREFATLPDRDAHGPKVTRADEGKSGTETRAGFGGAIGGQLEAERVARAGQRQRPDNRRAGDAGRRAISGSTRS